MRLRNKQTGQVLEVGTVDMFADTCYSYNSLAELNSEWEDVPEEPKRYWIIDTMNDCVEDFDVPLNCPFNKEIGNYFETKAEAERAVEKLKAWKRLKDKKFRFHEWYQPDGCEPFIVIETNIDYDDVGNKDLQQDLDLLFGGEE